MSIGSGSPKPGGVPAGRADGANTSLESLGCDNPRKSYSKLDKQDGGGRKREEMHVRFGIVGIRYGNCVTE